MTRRTECCRRGFSMTELLAVIAVIGALLGLLFPVISGFRKSGQMTKSMAHMRQVAGWLSLYAGDNRDFVVPSQFDYAPQPGDPPRYSGKVRSEIGDQSERLGRQFAGTWADIIWTEFKLGVFPEATAPWPEGFGHDYRYDSPDGLFYGQKKYAVNPGLSIDIDNPLRSAATNTRDTFSRQELGRQELATPYGAGAGERGLPGYFAANNFFNADDNAVDLSEDTPVWADREDTKQGRWYAHGQIRAPDRSMYLVDSFAGEVIQPWPQRYKLPILRTGDDPVIDDPNLSIAPEIRVDFRYSELCLMLFLDGHSEAQAKWRTIEDLEGWATEQDFQDSRRRSRGIRIRNLDRR
ncbi:MAG: type II secretion system protein [Planctomycetes bacterium]|nr:type II secretion system protein [Planctomycetota bacterium]